MSEFDIELGMCMNYFIIRAHADGKVYAVEQHKENGAVLGPFASFDEASEYIIGKITATRWGN